MIDYLLSSQAPAKGEEALAETGLPSLFANVALVALVIILRPAVEKYFGPAINKHTPISRANRRSLKAIFVAGHDFISPALDGFSTPHLEVKPVRATIATAVTVIKSTPTSVQLSQEQSTIGIILAISACLVFALVGTTLAFRNPRHTSVFSGTSPAPSASSSYNPSSSPQPSERDSTPPSDDSSDDSSGSGGRPPPVPIFDIFFDAPVLRLDKGVNTNDKEVGDMDGAPPPPPPSFPTPVEDGDAFKNKESITKWLALSLILSIISLVTKRLFKRLFKGHGKTQKNVPTPVASEQITVDEISGNFMTPIPSVTTKPVIKPTCRNMLPLVETEFLGTSITTLVTSTVHRPSRRFTNVIICILLLACLVLVPYFFQYYIDNHLRKTINFIFPVETRGESLKTSETVEITSPVDEAATIEDADTTADLDDDDDDVATSVDGEDVVAGIDEEDMVANIDGEVVAFGDDDEDADATSIDGDVAASIDEEDMAASIDEEAVALGDDDEDASSIGGDVAAGVDEEDIASCFGGEVVALGDDVIDEGDVAAGIEEEDIASGFDGEVAALDGDVVATGTGEDAAAGTDEDTTASINEKVVAPVIEEEILATVSANLMTMPVEEDISSSDIVGAGDTTLCGYENASPLAVDLRDILDASEDGIPFHDVFGALSICSSNDKTPRMRERSPSFINPIFTLPTKSEKECTVDNSLGIRVLSEHVPKTNIPPVSKLVLGKSVSIVDKASSTAKVDTASKENAPIVNINKASAPARSETLPVLVKSSAANTKAPPTEPLNPKAPSFVPPTSYLPVRQQPRQSSSTSLHYCYSPPSPDRPGLSASIHAPSPVKRALNASMHAPSAPPRQGLSASIHAPSPPPMGGMSASIHAPSFIPMGGMSDSIHAPSTPPRRTLSLTTPAPTEHEPELPSDLPSDPVPIPVVDLSPDRCVRRVIDPWRESNIIVLVGGASDSP